MSNSLGDIIDESIVSQKEVIIKFIQVTSYNLFIWDNQELENCPQQKTRGEIKCTFNTCQNTDCFIQVHGAKKNTMKKSEEE